MAVLPSDASSMVPGQPRLTRYCRSVSRARRSSSTMRTEPFTGALPLWDRRMMILKLGQQNWPQNPPGCFEYADRPVVHKRRAAFPEESADRTDAIVHSQALLLVHHRG